MNVTRRMAASGIAASALAIGGLIGGAAPALAAPAHAPAYCSAGNVCLYATATITYESRPTATYYHYGSYNFSNQYGVHAIFNHQTGNAGFQVCRNYGGTACDAPLRGYWYYQYNLTPYNSIRLVA